jgi:hypothetical protein
MYFFIALPRPVEINAALVNALDLDEPNANRHCFEMINISANLCEDFAKTDVEKLVQKNDFFLLSMLFEIRQFLKNNF